MLMKKKYRPYNFDVKYEYRTYKNIGVNHRLEFLAGKSLIYKIKKFIRNCINQKEKRYRNFDTYLQWKEYFVDKMPKDSVNRINLYHYLKESRDNTQFLTNEGETVAVPIYVAFLSISTALFIEEKYPSIIIILTMLFLMLWIFDIVEKMLRLFITRSSFYQECMNVLKASEEEECK